jgi:hypothetical protein
MIYCYSEHPYSRMAKRERIDAHVALLSFRPLILHGEHSYVTCSLRYFS